jgi:hypothetical protein
VVTASPAVARSGGVESLHVGIVEWTLGDELVNLIAAELANLGHRVTLFSPSESLPSTLDLLLIFGPFAPIAPLLAQLAAQPHDRRPMLIWWLTEQLWHPALPHWVARTAAELRSGLERIALGDGSTGNSERWQQLSRRGLRFRYYGDLLWLRRHGLLSILAVPSQWLGQFLRERGFDVTNVMIGGHPSFAARPAPRRDIPVLWLGTYGSRRRRRNLERIAEQLARRGVEVMRVDGVQHPCAYGAERAALLGRSVIVLNLTRVPRDCNLLRFALAAPNRALMISEPMLNHYPVHADVHYVEAPLQAMPDVVCRYLEDHAARERITEAAYRLVTTELTLARGVETIMRQAAQIRAAAATR